MRFLRYRGKTLTEQIGKRKAFTGRPTQAESNYIPLSAVADKACANCRFFMNDGCFIIEEYPEPIIATGYCDRHELTPTPEPPPDVVEQLAEAVVGVMEEQAETISAAIYSSSMYDMGKELEKPHVIERLLKAIQGYVLPKKAQSDLMVFKGADGKNYWLATFTNNFKDLEDEILSERAHKDFETRLDMGLTPMPELWAWHTEGTKHGQADTVWYQDHNMYAIGHFDDTPEATKAINFYRKHPVKLSHGFIAPNWAFKNGVYDAYNTFEISTLPPSVAANPYTSFEEIKAMPVPEKREAFINELFGDKAPDVLAKVNARNDASKELETMVEFKDFSVTTTTPKVETPETSKALSSLYTEVVEGQTELIGFIKSLAKALTAKDNEITALKADSLAQVTQLRKDIDDLRVIVNAPPRRASQDGSTIRTTAEEQTLKDKLPAAPDTFFGDLYAQPSSNGVQS